MGLCLEYWEHYGNAKYNYALFYNIDVGDSAFTVKIRDSKDNKENQCDYLLTVSIMLRLPNLCSIYEVFGHLISSVDLNLWYLCC